MGWGLNSAVVPAKTGTHNHRASSRCELLPQAADILHLALIDGYGSRRSPDDSWRILHRLARIRHRCRQPAVDRQGLAVDVGGLVAGEKQSGCGEFVRLAGPLQGI